MAEIGIPIRDAYEHMAYIPGYSTEASASLGVNPPVSLPYGADYFILTWVGGFVTVQVFKTGGASGTVVKTHTLTNDGTNYLTLTAS